MTRQRMSLRERQQEQARREIVSAALQLISAEGTEAITIDRLSVEANMARATLYARFPDGLDAIIAAAYAAVSDQITQSSAAAISPGSAWDESMLAWAQCFVDVSAQPGIGRFYNVVGPRMNAAGQVVGRGSEATMAAFEQLLGRAVGEGALPADAPVQALAVMLVGALRESGMAIARGSVTAEQALTSFSWLLQRLSR
ncbi:TetR/AcrR family transcriptional regulator [Brooklawnia sp.]|uniref:TetR/AcrR family transcriptional regulator n=1 Tax=Brooklawnia sp. TaxID=2699740 RepID=UPI00311E0603